MKIKALILLVICTFSYLLNAQNLNWRNYTDMKNIRSVVVSDNNIWAATAGGTFSFNLSNGSYQKFHKVEGLSGSNFTSAAVDKSGRIWFGSSSGHLDIYDPQTGTFKTILDIYNSLKQPKGINYLLVSGDTLFVVTDFGISVIDQNNFIFLDTYTRFGTLNSNIKVNNIFKGNLIYAALEKAIIIQKPGAVNLSSPDSWNVYTISSDSISEVAEYNGQVIAATKTGLYYLEGNTFIRYLPELENSSISKLKVLEGALYLIENGAQGSANKLYKFDGELTEVYSGSVPVTDVFSSGTDMFIATEDGIRRLNDPESGVIKPNAPYTNLFPSLIVDSEGSLWSASGRDVTGRGFYKFQDNEWTNYNIWSSPEISTNAYFNAYRSGNELYFGSWGYGFLRIKDNHLTRFDYTNTPMEGISNNPDFIVISGLSKDSRNNLWILNYASVTKEYLSVLTPDSTWYNFKIPSMQDQYVAENYNLLIDQQDTKWFYSGSTTRPGLFYFNENNTLTNTVDDKSGYLSEGWNDKILSLAIDNRGEIWVGTGLGVNIISNPSAAVSNNPQFKISSVFALRQQSINCIAVDPLNRKWIGTNQGLILVNSDGTSVLSAYNTENSPLLSDEIRSLVIDEQTGIVYAGTDAGLTSFETSAKKPVDTFSELIIYPNPLKIDGPEVKTVTIDGLIRDSEIKIISINGKLIQQFNSPGGRVAYWDGKDSFGEYVNSGIYIIVASDKEGNSVKSAKIAVLKQ